MDSPLDQAARALCLSQSGVDCFDDLEPEAQEQARETVRAVLRAAREPSEAQIEAGINQAEECTDDWSAAAACVAQHTWQAMIDTLLAP